MIYVSKLTKYNFFLYNNFYKGLYVLNSAEISVLMMYCLAIYLNNLIEIISIIQWNCTICPESNIVLPHVSAKPSLQENSLFSVSRQKVFKQTFNSFPYMCSLRPNIIVWLKRHLSCVNRDKILNFFVTQRNKMLRWRHVTVKFKCVAVSYIE